MHYNVGLENALDIVKMDADDIYLGNLNTVDTDLKLPASGKRGSGIQWHSGEVLFLSHDGKVTRPSHGVGNRIVPLTATLTYEDATFTRQFNVTVVERSDAGRIRYVRPVDVVVQIHAVPALPAIVIVEKDTGTFTTANVQWEMVNEELFGSSGDFNVSGRVENSELKAIAHIHVVDSASVLSEPHNRKQVFSFPGGKVRLGIHTPFSVAQASFLQFLLAVDDDQMLYNFRVAAGLDTKGAPPMTGWDSPDCNLRGHTTGHYLSALALAYAATQNERIKEKLCYIVDELAKCQDEMSAKPEYHEGFLSAYSEKQFDLLETYTTYPTIWAPYYTLHKIMAGLMDSYTLAHNEQALAVCSRLGDWTYNRLRVLPQTQLDKMWSMYIAGEFGGMIEVLVDLYFATHNEHYLTTAGYFANEKLYFPMSENVDTLADMHVNQHIPQIIGAVKLYEAGKGARYYRIAENFWQLVTHGHLYNIGGVGENEMFKRRGEIAAHLSDKTSESCATYNMLKLARELFTYSPEKAYMDYYENALYNHILSACDFYDVNGGTTYFMSLLPAAQKVFNTAENTCCHGTGLESPFKFTDAIYFYNASTLYVNLYIPSEVVWEEKAVTVSQMTDNQDPLQESFKINGSATFVLKLRKPHWASDDVNILINGKIATDVVLRNGYFEIERLWDNDTVQIRLPFSFRLERTPDNPTLAGISYGPYVLVALSDRDEYLTLDLDEQNINSRMRKREDGKGFEMDGITFLPFNQVYHQTYSAYFKVREERQRI